MLNKILVMLLIFSFVFSTVHFRVGSCEQENIIAEGKSLAEAIEQAFEKVMRKIEVEKAGSEEAIKKDLDSKLSMAIEDWISLAKKNRNSELNTFVEQQWERLQEFGPNIHYEYYLRGYEYLNLRKDIVKSGSILTPYKGFLNVKEALYVERHPLATKPRSKYYYTLTTPIKVSFEYQKDEWVVVDTGYDRASLRQGWSEEVIGKMKERFRW